MGDLTILPRIIVPTMPGMSAAYTAGRFENLLIYQIAPYKRRIRRSATHDELWISTDGRNWTSAGLIERRPR